MPGTYPEPEGALGAVLLRRAKESAALLADYDDPAGALAAVIGEILASEASLRYFVTKVDADDPYTHASLRATLSTMLQNLERSGLASPYRRYETPSFRLPKSRT